MKNFGFVWLGPPSSKPKPSNKKRSVPSSRSSFTTCHHYLGRVNGLRGTRVLYVSALLREKLCKCSVTGYRVKEAKTAKLVTGYGRFVTYAPCVPSYCQVRPLVASQSASSAHVYGTPNGGRDENDRLFAYKKQQCLQQGKFSSTKYQQLKKTQIFIF